MCHSSIRPKRANDTAQRPAARWAKMPRNPVLSRRSAAATRSAGPSGPMVDCKSCIGLGRPVAQYAPEMRRQEPFGRSTLRAAPANCSCHLFSAIFHGNAPSSRANCAQRLVSVRYFLPPAGPKLTSNSCSVRFDNLTKRAHSRCNLISVRRGQPQALGPPAAH
jgi:hypothetical protein